MLPLGTLIVMRRRAIHFIIPQEVHSAKIFAEITEVHFVPFIIIIAKIKNYQKFILYVVLVRSLLKFRFFYRDILMKIN